MALPVNATYEYLVILTIAVYLALATLTLVRGR
jgi:hypothetical protein